MVESAAPAAAPTPVRDGRRLRRERNRQAVVEALLALYREGNLRPSSEEVAARAGLSSRSLFRYFDDADDLCRAAIALHQSRLAAVGGPACDHTAPLAERIDALVEHRVRLFEAIGLVGVVARLQAPFQPLIDAELRAGRAAMRSQVRHLFATELEALGAEEAELLLSAVEVLSSFEAHRLLAGEDPTPDAAAVLRFALDRLLAVDRGAARPAVPVR